MKIAVLTDIHGNDRALQACLAHAKKKKVDAYCFLGDYLGEFAYPRRALEILYELRKNYPCYFLRGNKEDYWINRRNGVDCDWKDGNHSIANMIYNYENLTTADLDYFEALPISERIVFEGMEPILICHGTPWENHKKLLPEEERTKEILSQCEEKYILCGHTHIQRVVFQDEKKIAINVGAVGVPLHAPKKTQYMLMQSDGKEWKHEFVEIPYDVWGAIQDLHTSGLWDETPYWSRITKHLLLTGEISHGTALNEAMKCNDYRDEWYQIPDCDWEKALQNLQIMEEEKK